MTCKQRRTLVAPRLPRRLLRDERGTHMIELSVAAALMSVAVVGVMGSLAFGVTLVGGARQRSAGSTVASERLERVHNLPYERVALYEQPTHNPDPDHPDNKVTQDNLSYRVDETTTEPLIVDTANGALKHLDDPFTLGGTEFSVHQYVTWVDDAQITGTQNYKRVIVVVTWKFPVESASTNSVTLSTFISDGSVTVPQNTPPPPSPSPGPESTPPPEPESNPDACPGDTSGPTGEVEVLSGAGAEQGYTATTVVQVRLKATDPCGDIWAQLSNDGVTFTGVATLVSNVSSTVSWTIPNGEGTKTVHARFRDYAGNFSSVYTTNVVLDQTPPTIPSNFRVVSCTLSGNDRTVSLAWDASTDTNLLGYRLYRSVESASFQAVLTTSSLSASDTERKSHGSVRYMVRAYDKAGTESGDSNVLSFSKNQC